MILFLIGFMGVGKTTYGKKLAHAMDIDFIDLDEHIVNLAGKSINRIFSEEGEKHFRMLEAESLRSFNKLDNVVISLGGGAPCFHDNMQWLNDNGQTIYLKLNVSGIYSRLLNSKKERPLIAEKSKSEVLEYIKLTLSQRERFYEQAKLVIEAKDLNTKKMAKIVKQYLSSI